MLRHDHRPRLHSRLEWPNTIPIELQRVTSQALCNHFRGAEEYGFPMESEHFVGARLLKQL